MKLKIILFFLTGIFALCCLVSAINSANIQIEDVPGSNTVADIYTTIQGDFCFNSSNNITKIYSASDTMSSALFLISTPERSKCAPHKLKILVNEKQARLGGLLEAGVSDFPKGRGLEFFTKTGDNIQVSFRSTGKNEPPCDDGPHDDKPGRSIVDGIKVPECSWRVCGSSQLLDFIDVEIGLSQSSMKKLRLIKQSSDSNVQIYSASEGDFSAQLKFFFNSEGIMTELSATAPHTTGGSDQMHSQRTEKISRTQGYYREHLKPGVYILKGDKDIYFKILSDPCSYKKCTSDSDCVPNGDCHKCETVEGKDYKLCVLKQTEGCSYCDGKSAEKKLRPDLTQCIIKEKNGFCRNGECLEKNCENLFGKGYSKCGDKENSCCPADANCCNENKKCEPQCCNKELYDCSFTTGDVGEMNSCSAKKCLEPTPVFCDLENDAKVKWCCKTGQSCSVQNIIVDLVVIKVTKKLPACTQPQCDASIGEKSCPENPRQGLFSEGVQCCAADESCATLTKKGGLVKMYRCVKDKCPQGQTLCQGTGVFNIIGRCCAANQVCFVKSGEDATPQCIAPVSVAGGQAGQAGAGGPADSSSSSGDNSQGSGEDMSDIAQATQDANFIISLEEITSKKDFRAFEILSQWQKGEKDLRNTMIELKNIA